MIEFICDHCKNLNELDLQSCENIEDFQSIVKLKMLKNLNLYRTKCNTNDIISIIQACNHKLEYLNIGSCIQIDNMDLVLQFIALFCR